MLVVANFCSMKNPTSSYPAISFVVLFTVLLFGILAATCKAQSKVIVPNAPSISRHVMLLDECVDDFSQDVDDFKIGRAHV